MHVRLCVHIHVCRVVVKCISVVVCVGWGEWHFCMHVDMNELLYNGPENVHAQFFYFIVSHAFDLTDTHDNTLF